MLPLKPEPLVATAIALASWEYQRNTDVEHDRASADAKRRDASLRFVHFAGFWSHYDPESRLSSWPLSRSIGITDLAGYVEQHHRLESRPAKGDVFLLANYDGTRHVRAGIIAAVEEERTMLNDTLEFVCTTIEGELAPLDAGMAALHVPAARLVRRRLSPAFGDCFIRWCDLPPQAWPAALEYRMPGNLVILERRSRRRAA
jgi:hypothetical protein